MRGAETIREALGRWAGSRGPAATLLGECISTNEANELCVLRDELGLDIEVRLRPTLSTGGTVTIFPTPGSRCLAIRIEDSEDWCLMAASEVDKVTIVAGDATVELENGVKIARAGDGLREVLSDLIDEILAIYAPKNVGALLAIKLRITQLLKEV